MLNLKFSNRFYVRINKTKRKFYHYLLNSYICRGVVYIEFERELGRGLDSKACTRKRGVRPYTCVQASKPCARKTMHTRERININALSFVPQLRRPCFTCMHIIIKIRLRTYISTLQCPERTPIMLDITC